jgi:hypothetical protein
VSKLSKDEITSLALVFELGGKVVLDCDGYGVSMRFVDLTRKDDVIEVVMVYVDKYMKALWLNIDCPQSKFYRVEGIDNQVVRSPYFYTARDALEHINAASDSVAITKALTRCQWIDEASC